MFVTKPIDLKPLQQNLRKKIKEKAFSMRELSVRAGLSESYVKKLYRKNPIRPGMDKVVALAKALDCEPEVLLGKTAESKANKAVKPAANENKSAGELVQLGNKTPLPSSPDDAVLEKVANPHPDTSYVVRFTCPEFTSLCPVTGQPDFAYLAIDYIPKNHILESKSLKLYLGAFRNHSGFHEKCTVDIAKRIEAELKPVWLRIGGYWYPRGGIPIDIFYQNGEAPEDVWIPPQDVPSYRGRG